MIIHRHNEQTFSKALLFSVLLLILCLFLNGCCTKQACGAAFGLFHDNRYAVERTGHLNFEKRVFAVDIEIETAHRWLVVDKWIWHTRKKQRFELPLDTAPASTKKFEIHFKLDERLPKVPLIEFNFKRVQEGEGRYINPEQSFLVAGFTLEKRQDIMSDNHIHLRVAPEDHSKLTRPFYLYSNYDKKGLDGPKHKWRRNLMIPYKIKDDYLLAYSVGDDKSGLPFGTHYKDNEIMNPTTVLACVVLVPPALAIDIITAPIVIPVYIGLGLLLIGTFGH